MNVREKLVELLDNIYLPMMDGHNTIREYSIPRKFKEKLADYLLSNGVTVQQWISVTERLPGREEKSEPWKKYNVVVLRSHWPTSSYDLCDAPYDEEIVTTASYDSEQKIWHLDWGAQLNALIDIEDSPLNGDYVTHWMPLPKPPKEVET